MLFRSADFFERVLFTLIRRFADDDSSTAAWTRTWVGPWRVNTKPVGGPILTWGHIEGNDDRRVATFYSRQNAIDKEILFLNKFFGERK